STRLRIWGSGVRIPPSAPNHLCDLVVQHISCAPDGSRSGNEMRLVGGDRFDFAIEFGAVNRAPSAATAPFFPSATIPLSATHFCYPPRGPLPCQSGSARSCCRQSPPRNS